MKLWLISQTTNCGYDTYDSAVVAAETEMAARLTHPSDTDPSDWDTTGSCDRSYGAWTSKEGVQCRYIGDAAPGIEAGVICASFNAG
jgi:hypothetical protein